MDRGGGWAAGAESVGVVDMRIATSSLEIDLQYIVHKGIPEGTLVDNQKVHCPVLICHKIPSFLFLSLVIDRTPFLEDLDVFGERGWFELETLCNFLVCQSRADDGGEDDIPEPLFLEQGGYLSVPGVQFPCREIYLQISLHGARYK